MPSNSLGTFVKRIASFTLAAVAALCIVLAAAGCSQQDNPAEGEQQPMSASDYMVQLNQAAEGLREGLDSFARAVADDDVTSLQAKAQAAYESMDAVDKLEAPEELSDVSKKYKDAVSSLRTALDDYTSLYLDVANQPKGKGLDAKDYSERLENIQKSYDAGMNQLGEADAAASKL